LRAKEDNLFRIKLLHDPLDHAAEVGMHGGLIVGPLHGDPFPGPVTGQASPAPWARVFQGLDATPRVAVWGAGNPPCETGSFRSSPPGGSSGSNRQPSAYGGYRTSPRTTGGE